MSLIENIKNYCPYNEQEETDKKIILKCMELFSDVLSRENKIAHFSASSWIVNNERTKVLMVFHNIYNSWSWTGGHADGDDNLFNVALKEAKEETGISEIKVLSSDIFSVEIACVNGHEKKGQYVPSHLHLNVTYLFEANENEKLKVKKDENSNVGWIEIDKLKDFVTEEWMYERIYSKLVEKSKDK